MKFSIFWIIPIINSDDPSEVTVRVRSTHPKGRGHGSKEPYHGNCVQAQRDLDVLVANGIVNEEQWTRLLRNIQRNICEHDLRTRALTYCLENEIFIRKIENDNDKGVAERQMKKLKRWNLLDMAKIDGIRQGIETFDSGRTSAV
jgi:hypothetical protein